MDPEIIYAAALLHDIGRPAEYERGIPHDEAGAEMAEELLTQCGFSREETEEICSAILSHRKNAGAETTLGRLLRQADKASRCCFSCNAKKECKWPEEKMNLKVDC